MSTNDTVAAQADERTQPDERAYVVVLNHEEQYSIWPRGRKIPSGWREDGFAGPKQDCLCHIEEVWTDMRPLSLRRAMDADDQCPPQ